MKAHFFWIVTLITSTLALGGPREPLNAVLLSLQPGTYRYSFYEQIVLRHTPFHNRNGETDGQEDSVLQGQNQTGLSKCESQPGLRTDSSEVWNQPINGFAIDCVKEVTTFLEIVADGGLSERNELIPLSDLILEVKVDPDLHRPPTGINRVGNLSALGGIEMFRTGSIVQLLSRELRKSGSIILHADEAARIVNIIKEIKARIQFDGGNNVFLGIPIELQQIVDDAVEKNNRIIIIIRTPLGKKGPNAVNVKLA